jgi:hypothetical protein
MNKLLLLLLLFGIIFIAGCTNKKIYNGGCREDLGTDYCGKNGGETFCGNGWCMCSCPQKNCTSNSDCINYPTAKSYCKFEDGQCSGVGFCQRIYSSSEMGSRDWDPVLCGCDNKSYTNEFELQKAGVSQLKLGGCNAIKQCANNGEYAKFFGELDQQYGCCPLQVGFKTKKGMLCYRGFNGEPTCLNVGTGKEGWYSKYLPYELIRAELCGSSSKCTNGNTKNWTCTDDSSVNWCSCSNGLWNCIESPEKQCAVNCANEGEYVYSEEINDSNKPIVCCSNLVNIPTGMLHEDGSCFTTTPDICTDCGNGICGVGENKCNCPADCNDQNSHPCEIKNGACCNGDDCATVSNREGIGCKAASCWQYNGKCGVTSFTCESYY